MRGAVPSLPSYVFMVLCLIEYGDNSEVFIFLLAELLACVHAVVRHTLHLYQSCYTKNCKAVTLSLLRNVVSVSVGLNKCLKKYIFEVEFQGKILNCEGTSCGVAQIQDVFVVQ